LRRESETQEQKSEPNSLQSESRSDWKLSVSKLKLNESEKSEKLEKSENASLSNENEKSDPKSEPKSDPKSEPKSDAPELMSMPHFSLANFSTFLFA
jgi:hypothetical protein